MANLTQWLEEEVGESIEAIVIGEMGWGCYGRENVPQYSQQKRNQVLSYEEARPMIDYEFNAGYGAPGCNAITAWSKSYVIFISQYDGATSLCKVPRNPVNHEPEMPGGG